MSVYEKTIIVNASDLDELDHVNNIRYLEWVQEISKEHWNGLVDKTVLASFIWVVRNHNITYYKSAVLNDEISIKTMVIDWKGPISLRQVEMRNNKNGELLVMAKTEWCALYTESLRPARIPERVRHLFIKSK